MWLLKLLQWFSNYGTIICGLVGTDPDGQSRIFGWIIIQRVYFGISHLAHRSSVESINWDEGLLPIIPLAKVLQKLIEPNLINPIIFYHSEPVFQSLHCVIVPSLVRPESRHVSREYKPSRPSSRWLLSTCTCFSRIGNYQLESCLK